MHSVKHVADGRAARDRRCTRGRRSAVAATAATFVLALAQGAGAVSFLPDPAFGTEGSVVLAESGFLHNAAVQSSGRILVLVEGDAQHDLVGLRPDGSTDSAFGAGGVAALPGTGSSLYYNGPEGLVVQADDRIVVSGRSTTGEALVARLLPDGAPDPDFAADGILTPAVDPALCVNGGCDPTAATLDPGERIVVAIRIGPDIEADARIAVLRLLRDGAPDPTFGDGGVAILPTPSGSIEVPTGIAAGADGRVYVLGNRFAPLDARPTLVLRALTTAGLLDASFGSGGTARLAIGDETDGLGIVLDALGRIVVVGSARRPDVSLLDMLLVRWLPSGLLDRSFGGRGVVFAGAAARNAPLSRDVAAHGRAVAIAPDGTIIVAGGSVPIGGSPCSSSGSVALAAVAPSGRPQPLVDAAAWYGEPYRILPVADGRWIVVSADPLSCQFPLDPRVRVTRVLPVAVTEAGGPTPIRPRGARTLPHR